jgi:hypothetical protein
VQRRQTGAAFFLVTFSLAKQEKVTSCRSTTGGFVFCTSQCASRFAATLRQAQGERLVKDVFMGIV